MFFTYLGIRSELGGGGCQGIGTQPTYVVFQPLQLKNRIFETCFFDIVITQNDHPRYVKHVFGRVCVCLTLFGNLLPGGGGFSQGIGAQPANAIFHPGQLKNQSFRNFFLIL